MVVSNSSGVSIELYILYFIVSSVSTRRPRAVLKNFEFIVSERVQVNPDNSEAMSALTFLLFKLNTLQAKIVKF